MRSIRRTGEFKPLFIFRALLYKPYTVFKGHKRIIDCVENSCKTWANIVSNFKPGEPYLSGRKKK